MVEATLMIGSGDVPASDGGTFERLNPMTGEVATLAAAATVADAGNAVAAAAAEAFPAWSALGRASVAPDLLRAADCLERRAPPISSARWPRRPARPPAGRISTFISPPACCARRRR